MSDVDRIGSRAGRPDGPDGEAAAVTRFLTELRSLGEEQPPAPTAELEAIFAGATPVARRRRHFARGARRAALTAAAVVAGLVVAAANHALPATAQRVVSNVIDSVTPFHIDDGQPRQPAPPDDRHDHSIRPERDRGDGGRENEARVGGGARADRDDRSAADDDRKGESGTPSADRTESGDASDQEIDGPAPRTSSRAVNERERIQGAGEREASDGGG